jgi:preprotein translocase subunit YajC
MNLPNIKWQQIKWFAIVGIGLYIIGSLYALFFKDNYVNNNGSNSFGLLIVGLLLGGALMFFISKSFKKKEVVKVTESSHTIVESIKKVFKIVSAEGYFSEVYNYEETKQILSFIPSTKKAMVIVKAKVLVGFDFEQCVWETDEPNRKINLLSFPEPKILSIESDYQYYDLDDGLFNKFGKEDIMEINNKGKTQIEIAAYKSDLPKIAAEQMKTILIEVLGSKNWKIENAHKILID